MNEPLFFDFASQNKKTGARSKYFYGHPLATSLNKKAGEDQPVSPANDILPG
jgi:hypothetical protein